MFGKVYKAIITDYAKISITIICLVLAYFLYFSKDFKLDASSDSLLLESDKDLKYLREPLFPVGQEVGNGRSRPKEATNVDLIIFYPAEANVTLFG